VKFEDGTVADIPARDMEMQGDDNKKIGENEAEELVKEEKKVRVKTQSGTTERVSRDDLEAAAAALSQAIADNQHAAHQKKADKSRIRQRKWGDSVEYDGEHLDEKIVTGEDGVKRLKGAFHWPPEVTRPRGRRRGKLNLPRQLKNKKTEMMVSHPETGAVSVIDKKDWEEHEKQGYGVAESVEQNESLGGPGGPSREMSPNDMYRSGLRTNEILKKLEKLKKANKKKKTKPLQNKNTNDR